MESRKIKICNSAFVVGFIVLCASCNFSLSVWSPYTVSNKYVVVGKEEGLHRLAGAYIDVVNNSEKTIESGEISFVLFDSAGNPCGLENIVTSYVDLGIMPGEETEIIISLDKVLGTNLDESYKLDFVRFTKLNYEDGSVWMDPLGVSSGW
ncbi:MAG: hypothetical protein IKP60_11365 [Treponema sp.]|nr:hypothetical protein [Treponema sp.]